MQQVEHTVRVLLHANLRRRRPVAPAPAAAAADALATVCGQATAASAGDRRASCACRQPRPYSAYAIMSRGVPTK